MAAINIGNEAVNANASFTDNHTLIDKISPANATGTITSVDIWATYGLVGCKVGIFTASGNDMTARDSETVQISGQDPGVVPTGFQTATVDLDVEAGDYIGIYFTSGNIDKEDSGSDNGIWYLSGDQMSCVGVTFSVAANNVISLCGTGATAAAAKKKNIIFFGANF